MKYRLYRNHLHGDENRSKLYLRNAEWQCFMEDDFRRAFGQHETLRSDTL